jgi:probable HAF family extracellular repeat protein
VRPRLENLEERSLLSYTITDLGALGGRGSKAFGLNNKGQVVGEWETGPAAKDGVLITHGFIWDSAHGMRDLGTASGDQSSVAAGINDAGEIVGTSTTAPTLVKVNKVIKYYVTTDHAVTWSGTSKAQKLGDGSAYGVNGAGEVVGTSGGYPTLWSGGVATNLGTLGGSPDRILLAQAIGINAAGHVVGAAPTKDSSGDTYAFLWTPTTPNGTQGAMTNLGVPNVFYGNLTRVSAINALDEVVVTSANGPSLTSAILETGGRTYNLGTLGGKYVGSEASGLNASGVVVGNSNYGYGVGNGYSLAWVWTPTSPNGTSGQMTDLNSLVPAGSGWVLNAATAVNDAGQIVGFGAINGAEHAFLLTPTTAAASVSATPGPAAAPPIAIAPMPEVQKIRPGAGGGGAPPLVRSVPEIQKTRPGQLKTEGRSSPPPVQPADTTGLPDRNRMISSAAD